MPVPKMNPAKAAVPVDHVGGNCLYFVTSILVSLEWILPDRWNREVRGTTTQVTKNKIVLKGLWEAPSGSDAL